MNAFHREGFVRIHIAIQVEHDEGITTRMFIANFVTCAAKGRCPYKVRKIGGDDIAEAEIGDDIAVRFTNPDVKGVIAAIAGLCI